MIKYEIPTHWLRYDRQEISQDFAEAKAAVLSLRTMPYQRAWVDKLQRMELKMEVAGTSRIEGADFTDRELEAVLREKPEDLVTRSQRQAFAALQTYVWLGELPDARAITADLVCGIHRRIVTGADDDHCPPGKPRERDQNVNFGTRRHRGVEGGEECHRALGQFAEALQRDFREHDPLIQAVAAHYHLAAMHPFLDGNGRTARALEALLLQRAGLRDTCFIAMSNYYYDEKTAYLAALAEVRAKGHDLTPFLRFALRGVTNQVRRLLVEIQRQMKKALFRDLMFELFQHLRTPRRRVLADRQLEILKILLDQEEPIRFGELQKKTAARYGSLKKGHRALIRDLSNLFGLRAVSYTKDPEGQFHFAVRLEWPTEITETAFFGWLKNLPKAKIHSFR
jgi:Fic family protein